MMLVQYKEKPPFFLRRLKQKGKQNFQWFSGKRLRSLLRSWRTAREAFSPVALTVKPMQMDRIFPILCQPLKATMGRFPLTRQVPKCIDPWTTYEPLYRSGIKFRLYYINFSSCHALVIPLSHTTKQVECTKQDPLS